MNRIKFWLIENSKIQSFIVTLAILWTIVQISFTSLHFRNEIDFYTPTILLVLILWVYYSLLFQVDDDSDELDKIIVIRSLDIPEELIGKLLKLTCMVIFGHQTSFIFGKPGVLVALFFITITGLFCIYIIGLTIWNDRSFHKSIISGMFLFAFQAGVVGYIYFLPWKNSFCHEFGIKEIGNYFEKDTYEAKYIVEIKRVDKGKTYRLPANIIVSDDFSESVSTGSDENESSVIRFARVNQVFFKNGGKLYFNDCLVSIDNYYENSCTDQNGEEWNIIITKEKAN